MLRYLNPETKKDPEQFWSLHDRPFFGFGACHILAGVFLLQPENSDFKGVWIKPRGEFRGNHVIVTNGIWAFDYHGYSRSEKLLDHFRESQTNSSPGWISDQITVEFNLLCTKALNANNMRGPDQYFKNPMPRAKEFINRFKSKRSDIGV